ncbi:MAG TPA: helicase-exonuclease AddAB subunit AddA [Phycisphaerae bacterium]|nr:helicase-exonuclease AddAB subunit AddA [Phycisphaerae bacterium]
MTREVSKTTRDWTGPQREAIEHVAGDLVVSAAAGSGKTAVLAERCARLVCDGVKGGCGVDELLVLTFTEAAANEMRSRIAGSIRERLNREGLGAGPQITAERRAWLQRQAAMVERASISTLHSFCARVLRQHFHEAQIDPGFELVDEDEARLMREEAIEEVLGRWHKLPADDSRGAAFAEFFEAYAQGRDSGCRDMILRVYTMLATTAAPAEYLDQCRGNHVGEGCARMFDRFVREVVAGELRLLGIAARRAAADAGRNAGPDAPIAVGLKDVAQRIEAAHRRLQEEGAGALASIRGDLTDPWPKRLSTMKDVAGFDELKERTWERMKRDLKKLCARVLVHTPEEMQPAMATLTTPLGVLLELVADFEKSYTAAKRGLNRLDFSDLERLTLNLLTAPGSGAAGELRARYCHLLVDEFQDINPLQEALLSAVRSAERFEGAGNLFVVGDIKQSIYGFRLADPELFGARIDRARLSAGARRHVSLPHNFRSQGKLLLAMNGLFEKILTPEVAGVRYRDGHALEPSPGASSAPGVDGALKPFDGAPVELHLIATKREEEEDEEASSGNDVVPQDDNLSAVEREARFVADRIHALMQESRGIVARDGSARPLAYRDIAILLRSMKDKAMIFARALSQRGIPVHADLSTGYFDAAEIRDTLALLHVLDNPLQDIPMATVLLGPYGGFSHDDLATIRLTFDKKRVPFAAAVHRYVMPRGQQADLVRDPPPQDASLAGRLADFLKKLDAWRELLRTRPLHEGLARIYSDSKIMPFLAGLDAGEQRIANLSALHQRALKFAGFSKQGLHRFLRFIEKLREQEGDFGEAPVLSEASDVVRIMSVHKSKGLEFPVVIAAGLGGLLNLRSNGPVFVHRKLGIGMHVADIERNIFYPSAVSACITHDNERTVRAEELRLLYVALTRARDHLILTGHIGKAGWLDSKRAEWRGETGPLAEDALVRGRSFLDWIVPALASSDMRIQWPDDAALCDPQVTITLQRNTSTSVRETSAENESNEFIEHLLAGEALLPKRVLSEQAESLIAHITGAYPHADMAAQPAVFTVSELKKLGAEEAEAPGRPLLPAVALAAEESRLRGIATHRVLELLDFTAVIDEKSLAGQVARMVEEKRLAAEDAERADLGGIVWLLGTPAGKRVGEAASDKSARIRREIPFTWSGPLEIAAGSTNSADWPTIRGTIDLLLVHPASKSAEILDYKTDSPRTWQKNLPDYERQMGYYLRAASDILGFPVTRATLLFLTAREAVEIT